MHHSLCAARAANIVYAAALGSSVKKGEMNTITAKNGAPLGVCIAHRNRVEEELPALQKA
jgi:hypothetical protein